MLIFIGNDPLGHIFNAVDISYRRTAEFLDNDLFFHLLVSLSKKKLNHFFPALELQTLLCRRLFRIILDTVGSDTLTPHDKRNRGAVMDAFGDRSGMVRANQYS